MSANTDVHWTHESGLYRQRIFSDDGTETSVFYRPEQLDELIAGLQRLRAAWQPYQLRQAFDSATK